MIFLIKLDWVVAIFIKVLKKLTLIKYIKNNCYLKCLHVMLLKSVFYYSFCFVTSFEKNSCNTIIKMPQKMKSCGLKKFTLLWRLIIAYAPALSFTFTECKAATGDYFLNSISYHFFKIKILYILMNVTYLLFVNIAKRNILQNVFFNSFSNII